ncbi:thioesterase family protein [Flocculibacter collagenilyticus]|uniref:thioesterase family protein n=1 Tax=Flocculibacter collagenilyticus TaxID=2744479 RepID=UPI0018F2B2F2|nr:thioesterase family protein [Flocculibacter collagenilyticus]
MNQKQLCETAAKLFNAMPFNQMLGFNVVDVNASYAEIHFDWQDNFIGNPLKKILHGGVTAAVLDTVGGLVAVANEIEKFESSSPEYIANRLTNMGTIDLRTDYLRPGKGDKFIATAKVIRSGSKVAVCRMELHNSDGKHIAFGTGTYILG